MRRALLAGLLLTCGGGFVRGEGLSGRAVLTWQQFDTETFTTDGFHQTYDARWERQVTGPFRLRLSLRAEEDDGGRDAGFGRASRSFSQLQPAAEVVYSIPRLELQGRFDRLTSKGTAESGLRSERRFDRATARLSWRPDGLPGLAVLAESRDNEDPGFDIQRAEDLLQATVDYTWRQVTAAVTARHTTLDDGQELFARESTEQQGLVTHDGSLWGGRVTSTANVLVTRTRLDERATAGATRAARPVAVVRATHSVDETPEDDRGGTPRAMPDLVDGDPDEPGTISLGPASVSFQNIALDLGRSVPVDTVRIAVRDGARRPVPFGGSVRWDVYVSPDGATWSRGVAGATTTFTPALSHYEVAFDRVTTRFLKVVSFGVNSVDTLISEVQALEHVALGAGEMRHTDIRLGNATVDVTARPSDRLLLGYSGLFSDLRQDAADRPLSTSRGLDHTLTADVSPLTWLGVVGRLQRRSMDQTAGYRQHYDAWTAIARLQPWNGLQQLVEVTRSTEDNGGIRSHSNLLGAHFFARPYPALDVSFDATRQRQRFDAGGTDVLRTLVAGQVNSQLTKSIRLLVTVSVARGRYGEDTPVDPNVGLPAQDDRRFSTEVYYRASPQLALSARLGWADTGSVSGTLQRYHLDWFPFPGGSLRIGGQYDQDVDAVGNRQARRLLLTPAWQVNRRVILNLNYTVVAIPQDPAAGTRAFAATLTVAL